MKVYNSVEELDSQIPYLTEQVNTLMFSMDKDGMERFANQEFYNSEMQDYLEAYEDDSEEEAVLNDLQSSSLYTTMGMSYDLKFVKGNLKRRFRRLRSKINKAFCEVIRDIDFSKIDTSAILTLVISGIAASLNLVIAAVVLPLIIALVASLIKYGFNTVCPV